ncbi:MAG: hypothetical protein CM15mP71_3760 [Candidatus Poseidoniales archaeon]|nr:MAG: hypothetical protein CM15mP71_3760 [Candidatus Poseidoniales archaeon]
MCVNICPNSCFPHDSRTTCDVLDSAEGEWEGYGRTRSRKVRAVRSRSHCDHGFLQLATAHTDAPDDGDSEKS